MAVDLSRLELITRGNKNLKEELLRLFAETCDRFLKNLQSGKTQEDFDNALHELKGAAGNLGFSELSELCSKAENDAKWFAEKGELSEKVKLLVSEISVKFTI